MGDKSNLMFGFAIYLLLKVLFVVGGCPHFNKNLKRWSELDTWPGHKVPIKHDDLVINRPVLLDVSPPPLGSIVINTTGALVWSPEGVFALKVRYILIRGKFEMGSEDCRFTRKATITLTGRRGDYSVEGFGQKFIGVEQGGVLELHGREKLSWTKLNRTVPKMSKKQGILFHHKSSVNKNKDSWFQGLAVYVVDTKTLKRRYAAFYLSGYDKHWTERGTSEFPSFLKTIEPGKIVMFSVQNSLNRGSDLDAVYDGFEEFAYGAVTGKSKIRSVGEKDACAIILLSGDHASPVESVDFRDNKKDHTKVSVNYTVFDRKLKFTAISVVYDVNWKTYVDFYIKHTDFTYPILDLATDARTWKPGDQVVITSTDYSWTQAETGVVIDCPSCGTHQVRLDLEPRYTHWGEFIENVDMRGEVALLSRDIVIQGEMEYSCPVQNGNCDEYDYDTFGGNIQVMYSYANVHLQGIEVRHMGQQTDLGNYPIHFHMAGDARSYQYCHPAYVRGNSIHHTFARCVTIHGTHSLEVSNNVCYDCLGHAYFLEDGGEKWTVLDGNLGASTRKGSLIPSDETPTTFWIVNPLTFVRNNVAAGGEHTGFWFLFPDEPLGPSRTLQMMQYDQARHTPILEINNNVAHSNLVTGINVDQKLIDDYSVGSVNYYQPRVNSSDPDSPEREVLIYRMTTFKNQIQNVWIRGGRIRLDRASIADSARGVTFARTKSGEQFLSNSVVLGETKNVGDGTVLWNSTTKATTTLERSLHIPWDIHHPLIGFVVYDGPLYLENVWFNYFYPNENYTSSAIGFKLHNEFSSSSISAVKGLRFGFNDRESSGLRIFDGNGSLPGYSDFDGDLEATIRDLDGSLTSYPDTQLFRTRPFYLTEKCVTRRHWNLALCPHHYTKLNVIEEDSFSAYVNYKRSSMPFMVRDDIPKINETRTGTASSDFMLILGKSYSYSLHWTSSIPETFHLSARGIEKKLSHAVRVGICLPLNSTFDLHSWTPNWLPTLTDWTRVTTLDELDSDLDGDKYYLDEDVGVVFVKFLSKGIRTDNSTSDCPGHCPSVRVTVLSGNRSHADCRGRMYPKYTRISGSHKGTKVINYNLVNHEAVLTASKKGLPNKWGAGDTMIRHSYGTNEKRMKAVSKKELISETNVNLSKEILPSDNSVQ